MKRILNILILITPIFVTSCIDNDYVKEANYDFKTNYEAFWNLINGGSRTEAMSFTDSSLSRPSFRVYKTMCLTMVHFSFS